MLRILLTTCLAFTTVALPVEHNNPELDGGGVQGDMLFPPQYALNRGVGASGVLRRWPNRTIPYDLSAISDVQDRQLIITAMNQLMYDVGTPVPNEATREICVFFRPARSSDTDVLKVLYGNGCSATIGFFRHHEKTMNLKPGTCFYKGIIEHELLHVLGFVHEQARPDRDSYITVHFENIEPDQAHNFEKRDWGENELENQGFSYDYGSIMHYKSNDFSSNGKPTITPRQSNVVIGQREKLSPTDIAEVRHYYKC